MTKELRYTGTIRYLESNVGSKVVSFVVRDDSIDFELLTPETEDSYETRLKGTARGVGGGFYGSDFIELTDRNGAPLPEGSRDKARLHFQVLAHTGHELVIEGEWQCGNPAYRPYEFLETLTLQEPGGVPGK